MKRTALSIALSLGFGLALLAPAAAFAQDTPPPAPAADGGLPPPKVTTSTTIQTATAPKKEEEDPTSDHEKVVGHIGVGYLGFTNLPIAAGGTGGAPTRGNVPAPTVGVRWWLSEKLGLDLGVGVGITGGSIETVNGNQTVTTDVAGVFGLVFHGGVPLVFAHQKHMKFLVIPELNIGFATQTESAAAGTNAADITRNGFHLDLGGRIGTEIHFGFIGVPQLSLQATVGLNFRRDAWKVKQDQPNGGTNSASVGETAFGTTVQGDPWAVFVNNISAIYYLP